jgi:hypothetical protein
MVYISRTTSLRCSVYLTRTESMLYIFCTYMYFEEKIIGIYFLYLCIYTIQTKAQISGTHTFLGYIFLFTRTVISQDLHRDFDRSELQSG